MALCLIFSKISYCKASRESNFIWCFYNLSLLSTESSLDVCLRFLCLFLFLLLFFYCEQLFSSTSNSSATEVFQFDIHYLIYLLLHRLTLSYDSKPRYSFLFSFVIRSLLEILCFCIFMHSNFTHTFTPGNLYRACYAAFSQSLHLTQLQRLAHLSQSHALIVVDFRPFSLVRCST